MENNKGNIAYANAEKIYEWMKTILPSEFDGAPKHVLEAFENLRRELSPARFDSLKKAFAEAGTNGWNVGMNACETIMNTYEADMEACEAS